MKQADIEHLLQILVADGEVSRAALKVLTTSGADPRTFAPLFIAEVDALLANANLDCPHERRLRDLMVTARDRLLDRSPRGGNVH